jgi:hypothetical protein
VLTPYGIFGSSASEIFSCKPVKDFFRHPTSHFSTVQAIRQAWNQSSVKHIKLVSGPLQSYYDTDINKYTLEGNNKTINARINAIHSNHTSILHIDPALIPMLGFMC